jgi:prepilin-type N-terminal cleavage/methylation domain-containing protein
MPRPFRRALLTLGQNRRGFSLVELLIASFLSAILVAAVYGVFTAYNRTVRFQEDIVETQQAGRGAVSKLRNDVMLAGRNVNVLGGEPIFIYAAPWELVFNGQIDNTDGMMPYSSTGGPQYQLNYGPGAKYSYQHLRNWQNNAQTVRYYMSNPQPGGDAISQGMNFSYSPYERVLRRQINATTPVLNDQLVAYGVHFDGVENGTEVGYFPSNNPSDSTPQRLVPMFTYWGAWNFDATQPDTLWGNVAGNGALSSQEIGNLLTGSYSYQPNFGGAYTPEAGAVFLVSANSNDEMVSGTWQDYNLNGQIDRNVLDYALHHIELTITTISKNPDPNYNNPRAVGYHFHESEVRTAIEPRNLVKSGPPNPGGVPRDPSNVVATVDCCDANIKLTWFKSPDDGAFNDSNTYDPSSANNVLWYEIDRKLYKGGAAEPGDYQFLAIVPAHGTAGGHVPGTPDYTYATNDAPTYSVVVNGVTTFAYFSQCFRVEAVSSDAKSPGAISTPCPLVITACIGGNTPSALTGFPSACRTSQSNPTMFGSITLEWTGAPNASEVDSYWIYRGLYNTETGPGSSPDTTTGTVPIAQVVPSTAFDLTNVMVTFNGVIRSPTTIWEAEYATVQSPQAAQFSFFKWTNGGATYYIWRDEEGATGKSAGSPPPLTGSQFGICQPGNVTNNACTENMYHYVVKSYHANPEDGEPADCLSQPAHLVTQCGGYVVQTFDATKNNTSVPRPLFSPPLYFTGADTSSNELDPGDSLVTNESVAISLQWNSSLSQFCSSNTFMIPSNYFVYRTWEWPGALTDPSTYNIPDPNSGLFITQGGPQGTLIMFPTDLSLQVNQMTAQTKLSWTWTENDSQLQAYWVDQNLSAGNRDTNNDWQLVAGNWPQPSPNQPTIPPGTPPGSGGSLPPAYNDYSQTPNYVYMVAAALYADGNGNPVYFPNSGTWQGFGASCNQRVFYDCSSVCSGSLDANYSVAPIPSTTDFLEQQSAKGGTAVINGNAQSGANSGEYVYAYASGVIADGSVPFDNGLLSYRVVGGGGGWSTGNLGGLVPGGDGAGNSVFEDTTTVGRVGEEDEYSLWYACPQQELASTSTECGIRLVLLGISTPESYGPTSIIIDRPNTPGACVPNGSAPNATPVSLPNGVAEPPWNAPGCNAAGVSANEFGSDCTTGAFGFYLYDRLPSPQTSYKRSQTQDASLYWVVKRYSQPASNVIDWNTFINSPAYAPQNNPVQYMLTPNTKWAGGASSQNFAPFGGNNVWNLQCVATSAEGHPFSYCWSYQFDPTQPGVVQGAYQQFLNGAFEEVDTHPQDPRRWLFKEYLDGNYAYKYVVQVRTTYGSQLPYTCASGAIGPSATFCRELVDPGNYLVANFSSTNTCYPWWNNTGAAGAGPWDMDYGGAGSLTYWPPTNNAIGDFGNRAGGGNYRWLSYLWTPDNMQNDSSYPGSGAAYCGSKGYPVCPNCGGNPADGVCGVPLQLNSAHPYWSVPNNWLTVIPNNFYQSNWDTSPGTSASYFYPFNHNIVWEDCYSDPANGQAGHPLWLGQGIPGVNDAAPEPYGFLDLDPNMCRLPNQRGDRYTFPSVYKAINITTLGDFFALSPHCVYTLGLTSFYNVFCACSGDDCNNCLCGDNGCHDSSLDVCYYDGPFGGGCSPDCGPCDSSVEPQPLWPGYDGITRFFYEDRFYQNCSADLLALFPRAFLWSNFQDQSGNAYCGANTAQVQQNFLMHWHWRSNIVQRRMGLAVRGRPSPSYDLSTAPDTWFLEQDMRDGATVGYRVGYLAWPDYQVEATSQYNCTQGDCPGGNFNIETNICKYGDTGVTKTGCYDDQWWVNQVLVCTNATTNQMYLYWWSEPDWSGGNGWQYPGVRDFQKPTCSDMNGQCGDMYQANVKPQLGYTTTNRAWNNLQQYVPPLISGVPCAPSHVPNCAGEQCNFYNSDLTPGMADPGLSPTFPTGVGRLGFWSDPYVNPEDMHGSNPDPQQGNDGFYFSNVRVHPYCGECPPPGLSPPNYPDPPTRRRDRDSDERRGPDQPTGAFIGKPWPRGVEIARPKTVADQLKLLHRHSPSALAHVPNEVNDSDKVQPPTRKPYVPTPENKRPRLPVRPTNPTPQDANSPTPAPNNSNSQPPGQPPSPTPAPTP